ncbi:hypothetical protein NLG97_g6517 [Lecanicillium saksenae]|uniref:Uncharacterized protein n=1 Tax=Lecanicillium saksenae TaxID=468837 RepID=A0ACC1QT79_9HYPO|nr:hypothetical protein NLG97_g6517 [Lecanicillium saksenae]
MTGQFVWINGLPGVGKLTVARALHALLTPDKSTLVDNHSLIDQVTLARDHPDYNAERARVRDAAYAAVVHPTTDAESACGSKEQQLARVVIFTDFFTAGTLGTEWSQAHQAAAVKGGRPFLPIYLVCEREENLRRVELPERGRAGRIKLMDVKLVSKFMNETKIYRFEGLGVEIDVTSRKPEETAQLILETIQAQQEEQR